MATERKDVWASGDAYEPYVGRWSRLVARQFVAWLGVPPNKDWLDVETLEHLLLALIDDVDSSAVMKACKVDLGALREKLTNYIDNDLKTNVMSTRCAPAC
jgi:hypothetical protein